MEGHRADKAISITNRSDTAEVASFVTEISTGRYLHLASADGQRIATFSLEGSASILASQTECGEMIQDDGSASSDPFVNASTAADPFR